MTDDVLKIAHVPGIEPEEQPLALEREIVVDVKGSQTGEVLGKLGSTLETHSTAGAFAQNLRRVCVNCKNFDQVKAQALFAEKQKTADGQIELRNLRANLFQLGESDAQSLSDLGYCHAFSSVDNEVIVHPFSNCPTKDWGDQFVAIDRAAEKRGDRAYDQILRIAEGKAS